MGYRSIIRQSIQQTDTQYHYEQPNGHYNEQCEPEPSQYHGSGADSRLDAPVAEVLRYRTRGDGCRMLP